MTYPARTARAGDRLRGPFARLAALWPLGVALVAAVIGFQLVYGLRLVTAGDRYWSNPFGDMGMMMAGVLAGLRAPWALPLLTPDTLLAPHRVALVYTDSIPWLTALVKLLHLGRTFNVLGLFLFLSWLTQPVAMYALLRASGVRRASTLLAGSLLALMVPAWLARQMGHVGLCGQAIEIAALALAVHCARFGTTWRTGAGFVAVGVLATGIHAYHLPPVTLMLAAALGADLLQRRPGALRQAVQVGAAYVVAVGISATLLGYFVDRGGSGGVAALGVYEMSLISPFFPQGSTLAGEPWMGSWLPDRTPGQGYEGCNYFGAGALVLLGAALVVWRRSRGPAAVAWADPAPEPVAEAAPAPGVARRWGPLGVALLLLTLYSLGPRPYLASVQLFAIPLPDKPWMEPLALFRAHGRFFWTVGYAALAGALAVVDRSAGPRTRPVLLAAVVLLQAADMSRMVVGLHDQFLAPDALRVPEALKGPAFRGRDYRAYPAFFCLTQETSQRVIKQLSLIAERQGASINTAGTVRPPANTCVPPPADALTDAAPGDRRITVLFSGGIPGAPTTTLFQARSDCFAHGSFWICGRDLAGVPGLTPTAGRDLVVPTHVDADLPVGAPPRSPALLEGWSTPGGEGVWSDAPRAVLRLPHPDLASGFLVVTLEAYGYVPKGGSAQRAFVSVDGVRLAQWRVEGEGYDTYKVSVPAPMLRPGRPLDLAIDLPDAVSPKTTDPAGDPRLLGIGVRRVTVGH